MRNRFSSTTRCRPSSARIFTADFNASSETYGLFRVPINGGAVSPVAGPLAAGREIENFRISPDGSVVVYRADQDADDYLELYSVSIEGGLTTKISSGSSLPFGNGVEDFKISPDSSTVVYLRDTFVTEVYSVPITGGTSIKLNGSLPTGSGPFPIGNVQDFEISADSTTVVYRADQDDDEIYEIYGVPIYGGASSKLNSALVSGGDVSGFQISEDSSTVVYDADQDDDGVTELYSVPAGGGTVTRLNRNLVDGGDVRSFQISLDSSTVIYRADEDEDNDYELYHVAIDGGTVSKVNAPLVEKGDVSGFVISPDNSTVIYSADQDADGVKELYAAWFGSPDVGPLFTGYLGLVLYGAAAASLGLFTSSLSSNQIIAGATSAVALLFLTLADQAAAVVAGTPSAVLRSLSLPGHYNDLVAGVVELAGEYYAHTATGET